MLFPTVAFAVFFVVAFTTSWLLRPTYRAWLWVMTALSLVFYGWTDARYAAWSTTRAKEGIALVVPTWWQDEICYRVCLVNPLTTLEMLAGLLDDMASYGAA